MIRLTIIIITLFLIQISSSAQNIYKLNYSTESFIANSSLALFGFNEPIKSNLLGFTEDELNSLSQAKIPNYDRFVIGLWNPGASSRSDVIVYSSALLGASAALIPSLISKKWNTSIPTASILIEVNLLTLLSTEIVKNTFSRSRPYAYSDLAPISLRTSKNARKSFFSGHTSLSAANSFYAAKVFTDHYPKSRLKPLAWAVAIVIPAITAYHRVISGEHFLSDVLVGYSFGALIGYTIPLIHTD